jgi:hypothetical protein
MLLISLLVLVTIIILSVRIIFSPELRYHSIIYKLKAKLVFSIGSIKRLQSFPYVTWGPHNDVCGVNLADARTASKLCRPGDVGLHKDMGFMSNLAIPGAFKHAWIVVEDDKCVEAVSEGVLKRDLLYPLITDYAVILRPIGLTKTQVGEAISRANAIVGSQYDANFRFDFEETETGAPIERGVDACRYCSNIHSGGYHGAFSCTETVGFSYFPFRDKLNLFRTLHAGREAIVADDFLRMNFQVVWLSPSVTPEWAEGTGLHEAGRVKIKTFLESKK